MADRKDGGEDPLADASLLWEGDPADPARAEAARAEAERAAREREEAAHRLAAARAQIAEFERGRLAHKHGRGSRRARETKELLTAFTAHLEVEVEPESAPDPPVERGRPDGRVAGREILASLTETPETPDTTDTPPPAETRPVEPPPPAPSASEPPTEAPARSAPRTGASTTVVFEPRTLARRGLSWLLLASLVATVLAGLTLREDRNTLTVGIAATLAVLTLALYAVRASTPVTHLAVRGGLLEVEQDGRREVFDLTSRYTPVEVAGRPGRPGWKVVLLRSDGLPQVIDSSVVNPKQFMEVLTRYRPDFDADASTGRVND